MKLQKSIIAIVAVFTFAFFAAPALVIAQSGGITKRVALTNAKPCVILTGAVQPKNFDTYIFRARKGQTIAAAPFYYGRETNRPSDDEQGSSGFDFVPPGGKSMVDPQDVIFTAMRTGDYKILIRPAYRRTTGKYALKLSVTNKTPKTFDDLDKPPTCR